MPKRLIDGEALWRSNKLNQVQPLKFRAEYANIIPLAEADGTFEADPRRVWADVYSFNRPDMTQEMVTAMLVSFEKVGMLVRKADENGKIWGKFIGIDGRLPSESTKNRYKKGKPSLFKDVEPLMTESRQDHEEDMNGLDRFGLERKGLGLEQVMMPSAASKRKELPKEITDAFAADAEKTARENEEFLRKKQEESEFIESTRGQF